MNPTTPAPTDEALMLAYQAGDAGAFDALYARHRAGLFRFIRRQVNVEGFAEEIFQDVWMRLIDARANYEPRAKFTTWLFTIAHNRMMDHFRAHAREAGRVDLLAAGDEGDDRMLELPADDGSRPDLVHARKTLAANILAALDTLPSAQREAFVMQQEGDLSVEEIAQATGVNRETAKSRLRYAFAKLRRELAALRADQSSAGARAASGAE